MSIDEFDKNLPECWEIVTIGEITLPYETEQPAKKPETEFKYIDIGSIDNSTQNITNIKTFLGKDAPSRARRIVRKDDILFSTVRTYLKNIARVPAELDGVLTSTGIAVLRCTSGIDSNFLFYSVVSDKFIRKISSTMDGTLYPAVTDTDVTSAAIVIPPLNEQRRIVAKIEALKARSQRVKEALEDIPQLLDQFRQSVLAAAFRGDLTADWREQNPDVEPAYEFLEQIRNQHKAKLQTKGKLSKSKNFKISSLEINDLPEIPDTWIWIDFGELIYSIRSGSASVPQNEVSDYPILRSSSVRPGAVDFEDIRFLTKEQSLNKDNFLCEGDLLFTRLSGSIDYVGNCAKVFNLNNQRIQYPDRLFCAKLIDNTYSTYSELCFASPLLRNFIKQNAKSSAGHQRISMGAITEAIIPFPPLSEQQEIVCRVTSLFKFADKIAQQYQEIQPQIYQLDQSILSKAFRGELVPQDPDDEPASVLLERISAERAKLQTKTAKKSPTKTSTRRTKKTQPQQEETVQLELGLE